MAFSSSSHYSFSCAWILVGALNRWVISIGFDSIALVPFPFGFRCILRGSEYLNSVVVPLTAALFRRFALPSAAGRSVELKSFRFVDRAAMLIRKRTSRCRQTGATSFACPGC